MLATINSSFTLKNITIKNRFMRSATMENMADKEGFVTEDLLKLYQDLAAGGTGLIITGACAIEKSGKVWDHQMAVWDDSYIEGLEKIAGVIHRYGDGCKCAVQLHHGGAAGYGYSYGGKNNSYTLKDLTEQEIKNTIRAFGEAALRIRKAGFDAVAVHGAHGYLISQFLSPITNNRTDQWGGNLEGRLRFALEVCYAIREKAGDALPMLWKVNCNDYHQDGQGLEGYVRMAAKLTDAGVDLIEISGGVRDQIKLRARLGREAGPKEAYFHEAIKPFRDAVGDKALAITGGIRSLNAMENLLADGVDLIGISRPLICEPDLPGKMLKERVQNEAQCISCNKCLLSIAREPISCMKSDKI